MCGCSVMRIDLEKYLTMDETNDSDKNIISFEEEKNLRLIKKGLEDIAMRNGISIEEVFETYIHIDESKS